MKKLFAFALAAALLAPVFAAEESAADEKKVTVQEPVENPPVWPAVIAFSEWPSSPVVVGLRLTIPYSTRQESVTGIDLGLWGRCRDCEGLQVSIFRNDVKDTFAGIQVGLYNTVNRADLFSVQVGLVNESASFRGVQAGLVNMSGDGRGFQVGLVNCCETFYGYQVGLINTIRDAEVPMLPIVNIGF